MPTLPNNKVKWVLSMPWGWYEYNPYSDYVAKCVYMQGSTILHGDEAESIKQACMTQGKTC